MSIRQISDELKAKARLELNEDEGKVKEDIESIKEWLRQTKYINARMDDQWILTFLRGCKFSLQRTKEKLELYYTMRTLLPEFYTNRDPFQSEIQELLKMGCYVALPKTESPDSPRILMLRALHDPSKISPTVLFKLNMMIQDILINEDDQFIICGGMMVQDLKTISLGHMPSPGLMKKAMTLFQDAYPIRPKGNHFINIPSFFEMMYNFMKPFLNEKMKNRMRVHTSNDLEGLYKEVPKRFLPKDYGGEGASWDELAAEWKKKVESYKDWFLDDEQYKTDESKRPGKPRTSDEYFGGIEGSFRKLNVD